MRRARKLLNRFCHRPLCYQCLPCDSHILAMTEILNPLPAVSQVRVKGKTGGKFSQMREVTCTFSAIKGPHSGLEMEVASVVSGEDLPLWGDSPFVFL